jgi:putative iron-dependent peroxidase
VTPQPGIFALGAPEHCYLELDRAHVARTTVERDGEDQQTFRRNVAYGGATGSGTAFVGFSAEQWQPTEMLGRMAGAPDRIRDEPTRYLVRVSGSYCTVPSVDALAGFASDPDTVG